MNPYVQSLLGILLSAILTENFILVKFYGICPFMGVSKKIDTALGMGMAVTFVMGIAAAACWAVDIFVLQPLGLGYMQTVAFILVIASIVQVVEMFLKKSVPALYKALGIFLPLITTNCAVLGVALLNVQKGYDFLQSVLNGACGGIGKVLRGESAIHRFANPKYPIEYIDRAQSILDEKTAQFEAMARAAQD